MLLLSHKSYNYNARILGFFTAAGDKIRDKILSYLIAAGDTHFTRTELVSFSHLASDVFSTLTINGQTQGSAKVVKPREPTVAPVAVRAAPRRARQCETQIRGAVADSGHNSAAAAFGRRLPVMRLISIVKTSTEWPGILGGRPRAP